MIHSDIKTNLENFGRITEDQYSILYTVAKKLNSSEKISSLVETGLDLIIEALNAERGLFVRYTPADSGFSIIAARNFNRESIQDLSQFSSGILQKVISGRQPVLYHDIENDDSAAVFKSVQIHNIKSVIGVPVFREEQIWGAIIADSRSNRKLFNKENLHFLDFYSNLISLALNRLIAIESLENENISLKNRLENLTPLPDIIGNSKAMLSLAQLIKKVAATDATVLLLGESGTGKDLIANAIHKLSRRSNAPYLAQYCGSIPDSLLESELFGYKKGAFSGAVSDKKGLFEAADSGTFFLDEIADVSLSLQAKLLRVLQNREIIRIGDTSVKKVDVRIISATNKDLKKMIRNGEFREDLFYRLNVFPVTIPPLRERKDDIILLANHFIGRFASGSNIRLHKDTIRKLESYDFPGNVRQLENMIQRAVIFCDGEILTPDMIDLEEQRFDPFHFDGTLNSYIKNLLLKKLDENNQNKTQTAKTLGVSVRWIQKKLKELEDNPSGELSLKFGGEEADDE